MAFETLRIRREERPEIDDRDLRALDLDRILLALDQDCSRDLLPAVLSFIGQRRLYGKVLLSVLKSTLSPTRAVAKSWASAGDSGAG
jgi:hypothetical protein